MGLERVERNKLLGLKQCLRKAHKFEGIESPVLKQERCRRIWINCLRRQARKPESVIILVTIGARTST